MSFTGPDSVSSGDKDKIVGGPKGQKKEPLDRKIRGTSPTESGGLQKRRESNSDSDRGG